MRKNGIEIVKISLEQQNKINKMKEKRMESEEKRKKKEELKKEKNYKKINLIGPNVYHKKIPVQSQFNTFNTNNNKSFTNRNYNYENNRNDLNKTSLGFYNDNSRRYINLKYHQRNRHNNNFDEYEGSYDNKNNNYSFNTFNAYKRGQKTVFIERGRPNAIHKRGGFRGKRGYY